MNTLNYSSKANAMAVFKNITFSAYKSAKGAYGRVLVERGRDMS